MADKQGLVAEPVPGTEVDVRAQYARCVHCTLRLIRTQDSHWYHVESRKTQCADLNVKLADIRAARR